ncbi:DUF1707 domain-containing protein [Nocardia sp. NPDC006630]|uniref:DUF1707 domain-containing protein n=1 Tax=Nocardia sp. NPDC006630 TaxID=3157181 RepID=UPI0033ADCA79
MSQEHMRASNADREQIVAKLRTAMDDGRIDLHEFDERLQQVYAAKTYGELAPVLSDLPVQRVSRSSTSGGTGRGGLPTWVIIMWIPWVFVNILCLVIWLATGAGYFWPFWVAVPWGLALLIPSTIGIVVGRDNSRTERAREQHRH